MGAGDGIQGTRMEEGSLLHSQGMSPATFHPAVYERKAWWRKNALYSSYPSAPQSEHALRRGTRPSKAYPLSA